MTLFAPPPSSRPQEHRDSSGSGPVKTVLSGMGITKGKIRKVDAIARANHPNGHKPQRAYSA
jgi:hypothetical protein